MGDTGLLAPSGAVAAPRPPSGAVLAVIGVAGLTAAALTVVLAQFNDQLSDALVRAALADVVTVPYILAGLAAWSRRPESRLGRLMIAAGFANFLGVLQWSDTPLLHTFGQALDFLPPVLFLHVFLAFPTGRLERRVERLLVAAAYGTAVGLELIWMLLGDADPLNLLQVAGNAQLADVVQKTQLVILSALALCGIGLLWSRRRRAGRPLRRSVALLVDSFALGLAMLAVLFLSAAFGVPGFEPIRWATFAVLGLAPVAFLVGLLHARLARSAVADLLVDLRSSPAPADLRDALSRALRDPTLALAFWLPTFGAYVDLDGRPVEVEEDGARATTFINRDDVPIAALLHDRALGDEPELLYAVSAAAGMALDNARLHAELRARLDELTESRARIVEAGQQERQRLERNLHDGAQQRLIALSLELGRIEEQLRTGVDTRVRLDHARHEIAASLEELRTIARGLHPAVVTGHGLPVALETLTARAPVPVRLTVVLQERLPESLEIAAYYVIVEALANIAKHAQASAATVDVTWQRDQVVVEVIDNGLGGADAERGSGLRGLADRVETVGGRLQIWSPRGGGTRLRAELPCAS